MDMEVWSAAIPQMEGTRPFEQIPFLVSFYNGDACTHFFSGHAGDGRRQFAEELIHLSSVYGSVIVYDKTLEINVINALIHNYPDLASGLGELKTKLVDVFEIFLDLRYYHPAFKSNFSLKVVSSVLLQDVHYPKIASGLEAMNYFERYRAEENELEKELLKTELVDYCNTDTLATFKLVTFLEDCVRPEGDAL